MINELITRYNASLLNAYYVVLVLSERILEIYM